MKQLRKKCDVSVSYDVIHGVGVVTDIDGNYSIEVSSSGTLIFSYVGFETASEKVNGRKVIDVKMKEKSDIVNLVSNQ